MHVSACVLHLAAAPPLAKILDDAVEDDRPEREHRQAQGDVGDMQDRELVHDEHPCPRRVVAARTPTQQQ